MLRLQVPYFLYKDTEVSKQKFSINCQDTDWFITHMLDGKDKLTFTINSKDDIYKYIIEEAIVETDDNVYLIKNIDEHSDFVTVYCIVNIDDFKSRYFHTYSGYDKTIQTFVSDVIPTGWSYKFVGDFTEKKSIGYDDKGNETTLLDNTSLSLIYDICDAFDAVPSFNSKDKMLTITKKDAIGFSGEFYSDEVNLKSLGFVGNTNDYVTKVYGYGAKDKDTGEYLTISSVNAGKDYVENKTYTDKEIIYGFTDTSITDTNELYNKCIEYLYTHSAPARSYQLQVQEVSADLKMLSTCIVIDSRNDTREYHQVVQYKEYPNAHYLDTVTLDGLEPDFSSLFKKLSDDIIVEDVKDISNRVASNTSSISNLDNRVKELEEGSGGGGGGDVGSDKKIGGKNNQFGALRQYEGYEGRTDNHEVVTWDKDGIRGGLKIPFGGKLELGNDLDYKWDDPVTVADDERALSVLGLFSVLNKCAEKASSTTPPIEIKRTINEHGYSVDDIKVGIDMEKHSGIDFGAKTNIKGEVSCIDFKINEKLNIENGMTGGVPGEIDINTGDGTLLINDDVTIKKHSGLSTGFKNDYTVIAIGDIPDGDINFDMTNSQGRIYIEDLSAIHFYKGGKRYQLKMDEDGIIRGEKVYGQT